MPKWKESADSWVAEHKEGVKLDLGDITDQQAWLDFSLHLQAAVEHCHNRVELIEYILLNIKSLQSAKKFPDNFHAQLSAFFDPDDMGELLIGDLERRRHDRDA